MTSLKIGVIYLVAFLSCHREERNVVIAKLTTLKYTGVQAKMSVSDSTRFSLECSFFLNMIWSKCFWREVSTLLYTSLFLPEFSFHYRTEEVKKYFSLNMWFNGFSSLLLFMYVFYQSLFGYKSVKSISISTFRCFCPKHFESWELRWAQVS